MLADTHCHLDFNRFDEDRYQVVDNAREAGITRILNPGINIDSSKTAIELSRDYDEVYAAIGIHPNEGLTWNEGTSDLLREMAANPKVVAIGEIGLDYYRDQTPRDIQQRIFREQLNLAADLQLPVIIHSRESLADILSILKHWVVSLSDARSPLVNRPGVLHSFSGTASDAQQAQQMNFKIGITGPVTFHNAKDLQDVVRSLQLDQLMTETDSPFLTPHPMRGKRNEPANVKLVADKLGELLQASYNSVAEITSSNAKKLFQW